MHRFLRETLLGPVSLDSDRTIRNKLLGKFSPLIASVGKGISQSIGRECYLHPVYAIQSGQLSEGSIALTVFNEELKKGPADFQEDTDVKDNAPFGIDFAGDLIILDDGGTAYYLIYNGKGVEIGWFGEEKSRHSYEEFRAIVEDSVRHEVSASWRLLTENHKNFSILSAEWGQCPLGEMEEKAGKLLSRKEDREFLRHLGTLGRSLIETALEGKESSGNPPVLDEARLARAVMLQQFESLGVVKREYVIFCQQTKNQISMVESLGAIEEASRRGFKCFYCGRSFVDERIDQLVSLTTFGMRLVSSHYWVALQFHEASKEHLSPSQILWTEDNYGGTIDFIVSVDGGLTLIIIKEGTIKLDDAFRIKVKSDLYRPDLIAVVTTVHESADVKKFLKGINKPVLWLTKINELGSFIADILDATKKEQFKNILADLIPLTTCDVKGLVMDWFFPGWQERRKASLPSIKEASPPPSSPQLSHPPIPPPPKKITPPPPSQKEPPKKAMEDLTKKEPEDLTVINVVKEELIKATQVPVISSPPVPEEIIREKITAIEEIPHEEIPKEVIAWDAWEATPPKKEPEGLAEIAAKAAQEIQTKGIMGRESIIQILLLEVKKAGAGAAEGLLLSDEGLVVATTIKEDEGELLAPYCLEVVKLLLPHAKLLREGAFSSVVVASKARQVRLYPCGPFYLAVFSKTRVPPLATSTFSLANIPKEMHLSAIVTDVLSLQVSTAVLTNKEGLVISSVGLEKDTMALAALGSLGTEIFSALSKWVEKMLDAPLWFLEWEIGPEDCVAILFLGNTNLVIKLSPSVTIEEVQEKFGMITSLLS